MELEEDDTILTRKKQQLPYDLLSRYLRYII